MTVTHYKVLLLTLLAMLLALPVASSVTVKRVPISTTSIPVDAQYPLIVGEVSIETYTNPNPVSVSSQQLQNGVLYTLCTTANPCRYTLRPLASGEVVTIYDGGNGNPIRIEPNSKDQIMSMTAFPGYCIQSSGNLGDMIMLLGVGSNEISVLSTYGAWSDVGSC